MKKIVLSIHIVLLLAAAGALVYAYLFAADEIDTITRLTFWLVIVSAFLGIVNYQWTAKKE